MLELNKDRDTQDGNGVKTSFDFDFFIQKNTDLKVYLINETTGVKTLKNLTTDYSVTNIKTGKTIGFTVVFSVAPTSNEQVFVIRDMPFTQGLDIEAVTDFDERKMMGALDKLTALAQQLNGSLIRTIRTAEEADVTGLELPSLVDKAGNALIVNATEDGIDLSTISIEAIQDAIDDAEAAAEAAANSATIAQAAIGVVPTPVASNYLRQKPAANGLEYRTPAQVKSDIGVDERPKYLVGQCVNSGKVVSSLANAIGAGTGLRAQIQAATVNMIGNNQSGDTIKKFILNSDFNIPKDAPANRRSSVVLLNGSSGDPTTDATKWDYACQRRQRGPSFDATKNVLLDFSSSLTSDKYGNTVTVVGNPTLSGGKYVGDGTGDGLKIDTIKTLGRDKWCIEGRFKFSGAAKDYDQIIGCNNVLAVALARNSANKLVLSLSSNNSTWNIASSTLGSKANYNNTDEYHIAVEFDGSTYKVYVDGVLDITVTSSSTVYSAFAALVFGIHNDATNYSLAGTMDDIRVTIGNVRYGAAFTPPVNGSLTPDAYWEDTLENKVKYGSPASWAEVEAVFIGEVVTNATTVTNAVTYAYNRSWISSEFTIPTQYTRTALTHNIGIDNFLLYENSHFLKNVIPEQGYAYGDILQSFGAGAGSATEQVPVFYTDAMSFDYTTGNSAATIYPKATTTAVTATAADWKIIVATNVK